MIMRPNTPPPRTNRHHHFICLIIRQYAHLHRYYFRRAGQQGPTRTPTAALKRALKQLLGSGYIFYHTSKILQTRKLEKSAFPMPFLKTFKDVTFTVPNIVCRWSDGSRGMNRRTVNSGEWRRPSQLPELRARGNHGCALCDTRHLATVTTWAAAFSLQRDRESAAPPAWLQLGCQKPRRA